ncbi:hypothetical protein DKX38_005498 [Salix brachista]|uniref:Uncharacterized protein n=1 Tax=Salix brachista TaxID=2182728 RepID=A0A5N5N270_9ROSI|nr:hypothetical protein DKX38_005498 [Salix brachista]
MVKRAYDNWMHVIEYDGRSLPDLKQNQGVIASQNDVPSCKLGTELLRMFGCSLRKLSHSSLSPDYNNGMAAIFSIHAQNGTLSRPLFSSMPYRCHYRIFWSILHRKSRLQELTICKFNSLNFVNKKNIFW